MHQNHPQKKVHYVVQSEMKGQSHALYLAKDHLSGPMIMTYSDTLIEPDLTTLASEANDGIAWVKPVPDPRRFGVAELNDSGLVTRMIEKPQAMDNNLALVGFYYFRSGEALVSAIEEQFRRNITLKNEFFLVDAINIMLEQGFRMRTEKIDTWLDAGIPEALLETNRYMLTHGYDNSADAGRPGVAIIPPVFIHPGAQVEDSVIGPHVSIEKGCQVKDSVLKDTILGESCKVERMILKDSLVGQNVNLEGNAVSVNIGDTSTSRTHQ